MEDHLILGVHVTERLKHASQVQSLLTEYGCHIKTRLGLHEVSTNLCSSNGLLILEMFGDLGKCRELAEKLNAVGGVEVKQMNFAHP